MARETLQRFQEAKITAVIAVINPDTGEVNVQSDGVAIISPAKREVVARALYEHTLSVGN